MVDPSLRQSPLATLHLGGREGQPAPEASVHLAERRSVGKINLRADPGDGVLMNAFESVLGYPLPLDPNRTSGDGKRGALRLGPDEWLVTVPGGQENALFGALGTAATAAGGKHVALSNVSDARTILTLAGPRARDVLQKGCGLDLHPRAFQTGHCAGTLLARAAILLHQTGDAPAYDIHVAWSFAAYLWVWLEDAGAEYGVAVGEVE
ncbi:MAG: sarcosine oxidase subunit gamma [Rhodospirillaceae bacterium]|nr:sarcosine oxidase subunit gamma [Rhodospirillaceae bacterium]